MGKAIRDRIRYPTRNLWYELSDDSGLWSGEYILSIFDFLGDLVAAIEDSELQEYSAIDWNQLTGLPSGIAPSPITIATFVVGKANPMSVAYDDAITRRRQRSRKIREDLEATPELLELDTIIHEMFRKKSTQRVLEKLFQNTESLQDLIDLLQQQSSNVVSSYDAICPCEPPQTLHRATSGSSPSAPDTKLSVSSSVWDRMKRRISSSELK